MPQVNRKPITGMNPGASPGPKIPQQAAGYYTLRFQRDCSTKRFKNETQVSRINSMDFDVPPALANAALASLSIISYFLKNLLKNQYATGHHPSNQIGGGRAI